MSPTDGETRSISLRLQTSTNCCALIKTLINVRLSALESAGNVPPEAPQTSDCDFWQKEKQRLESNMEMKERICPARFVSLPKEGGLGAIRVCLISGQTSANQQLATSRECEHAAGRVEEDNNYECGGTREGRKIHKCDVM